MIEQVELFFSFYSKTYRDRGNKAYAKKDLENAIGYYCKAIVSAPLDPGTNSIWLCNSLFWANIIKHIHSFKCFYNLVFSNQTFIHSFVDFCYSNFESHKTSVENHVLHLNPGCSGVFLLFLCKGPLFFYTELWVNGVSKSSYLGKHSFWVRLAIRPP